MNPWNYPNSSLDLGNGRKCSKFFWINKICVRGHSIFFKSWISISCFQKKSTNKCRFKFFYTNLAQVLEFFLWTLHLLKSVVLSKKPFKCFFKVDTVAWLKPILSNTSRLENNVRWRHTQCELCEKSYFRNCMHFKQIWHTHLDRMILKGLV